MNTIINATQKQVAAWAVERPQITEEDHKGVTDTLDRLTKWLEEKEANQVRQSKYVIFSVQCGARNMCVHT